MSTHPMHADLYKDVDTESSQEANHYQWLELVCQNIWVAIYENDNMIPSTSALWSVETLHGCNHAGYIINTWKQADKNVMTLEEPRNVVDGNWKEKN